MLNLLFYTFSSIAVFSAMCVVLSRNTVKSVLFLIVTFVSTAFIWLLLEAEFLAITLILVYVGAVIVLFLFVVMMIDQESEIKTSGISYFPLFTGLAFLIAVIYAMDPYGYGVDVALPEIVNELTNVKILGIKLYSNYLFAFEVTGLLFLVGMVAAIAVSFRGKQDRLDQDADKQININHKDRFKLKDI